MTTVESVVWGSTPAGEEVRLFTLTSEQVVVTLATHGARITSVRVADRDGVMGDVTLGADDLETYVNCPGPYMGAIVGRFANRIAGGRFALNGTEFQLPLNDGPNSLHGGTVGFDQKVWAAEVVESGVSMTYVSPDGEMGYPGTLRVRVTYRLTGNELRVEYEAESDKATVVNLTNHAYWNLSGRAGDIGGHVLKLPARAFTPVDATLIPTGEIRPVEGTPLDFLEPHVIGARWDDEDEQIALGRGYDHNWVLPEGSGGELQLAAELSDGESGRTLRVSTTEPGIQFYSGNFLDGSFAGRSGACEKRYGLCLETQHFPDSPNQPEFPSTTLEVGEVYRSVTMFSFGA